MSEKTNTLRLLTVAEARDSILRRRSADEMTLTPEMTERNLRLFGEPLTPDQVVSRIIREVRASGDTAVRHYTRLFDGTEPPSLRVTDAEMQTALLPEGLLAALKLASARIRAFHERQPVGSWTHWDADGAVGQIARPLERVGLYVPGGQAVLFSSLLMAAIPARVAGVKEIVVASPPDRNGQTHPALLAAAKLAGVDAVYRMGGAQAIAALAYGTETVPKVDKILGPGNLFVVLAKRQVFGAVDIDQLPGPTETVLIADGSANPRYAAADLLAQAEHDPLASAILLTDSLAFAQKTQVEVENQLIALGRSDVIRASLGNNGGVVLTNSIDEAIDLANQYAPEHLCLLIRDPWPVVGRITNAGGIFVGEQSSEALGDYVVGPSHIMPTNGTARFSSPLSVRDFIKITSLFAVSESAGKRLGPAAILMAEAEGLDAHANAVRIRQ